MITCTKCHGTGEVPIKRSELGMINTTCWKCQGKGVVDESHTK